VILDPVPSPHLAPLDGTEDLDRRSTRPPAGAPSEKAARKALKPVRGAIAELQRRLWADGRRALLVIFQARDAAGKDSTIRHVLRGVNPAGVRVTSFGPPTPQEAHHDFLWRGLQAAPPRGTIGVHNRSWYEEVLTVRVHPELLDAQNIPRPGDPATLWQQRLESIRQAEQHLARNGTTVVKLFLHVSPETQRQRLLSRLEDPRKHWKMDMSDLTERARWTDYDRAWRAVLAGTSRKWAPWYVVPADDKPYMRLMVARLLLATLERIAPEWPAPDPDRKARFEEARRLLQAEGDPEEREPADDLARSGDTRRTMDWRS
jgi:PPK2 family polyphosphate:nucleotide phosphotransferase